MRATWALVGEILAVLPAGARRFFIGYSTILGLLSILDGAALALLAVVVTPLVSQEPLNLPIIGEITGVGQFIVLGVVCLLIVLKGVLAMVALWFATRRFAGYELAIGDRLFERYIAAPWVERLRRNSADLVRISDISVAATMANFLLPIASIVGEVLNFATVLGVLAIAQPTTAIIAILYLGLIGVILFFVITRRTRQNAQVNLRYMQRTSRLVTEMIGALKEITLRNKERDIAKVVHENREHQVRARSNVQFYAQVPRYVLETGIIGGFVLVGVAAFVTGDAASALTAVAVFGLAGFRLAPSVIRFQSVLAQVAANTPHAQAVLDEIRISEVATAGLADRSHRELPEHPRSLVFDDVAFRYGPDAEDAVRGISLEIPFGSKVAFVGQSGAGKSTMVDLVLGLIEPTSGTIRVDDLPLHEVTRSWRSRVGYVPQDVALFDATIAQNVALSWTGDIDEERVRQALRQAQLLTTVEARDDGIQSGVGERGLQLSGGQRQRLGIARALYAEPLVLVMDEATSALDTSTEAAVGGSIAALGDEVTVITVAHRLATIRHADRIFFMSGGEIQAQGTFEELVKSVPEFATQAALAGLLGDDAR